MTVKQLIEKLQEFPQDCEVQIEDEYWGPREPTVEYFKYTESHEVVLIR